MKGAEKMPSLYRPNASAATLTKNRTEDSIVPLSGMCVTCVDGCIGMCEIGKSAYRGHEVIYPQPFGVITAASEKFPNESYFTHLKNSLKERKEWLQIQKEHRKDKNMVQWSEDFEESMERATRENKPVIIEFYTTWSVKPWNIWSKFLEEKTYPDPRVQLNN